MANRSNIDSFILIKIFIQLSDEDLKSVCLSNSYFYQTCLNNDLWKNKILNWFGKDVFQSAGRSNYSLKSVYWELKTILLTEESAKKAFYHNKIYLLNWLFQNKIYPKFDILRWEGIFRGSTKSNVVSESLEWSIKKKILPIKFLLEKFIQNGYLEGLKLLAKFNIFSDYCPGQFNINKAASCGYLDLLKWLAEYNFFPDFRGTDWAIENNRIETVKWLVEQKILPSSIGLENAAYMGYLNILKILVQFQVYPIQSMACAAAKCGHLDILKWLTNFNIFPDQDTVNNAALGCEINVLDWLAEEPWNLLPNHYYWDVRCHGNELDLMIKWLKDKNLYFDESLIYRGEIYDGDWDDFSCIDDKENYNEEILIDLSDLLYL